MPSRSSSLVSRRAPYTVTDDGDIDVSGRKITGLGNAVNLFDAVNFQDCVNIIERYVIDYDIPELQEREGGSTRLYDMKGARVTAVADPSEPEDAVNLRSLKGYVDSRFAEISERYRSEKTQDEMRKMESELDALIREVVTDKWIKEARRRAGGQCGYKMGRKRAGRKGAAVNGRERGW